MVIKNLELTTGEKEMLRVWLAHREQTGADPSKRYMAKQLDVHENSVRHMMKSLERKGWLREKKITVTRLVPSAKAKKAL